MDAAERAATQPATVPASTWTGAPDAGVVNAGLAAAVGSGSLVRGSGWSLLELTVAAIVLFYSKKVTYAIHLSEISTEAGGNFQVDP